MKKQQYKLIHILLFIVLFSMTFGSPTKSTIYMNIGTVETIIEDIKYRTLYCTGDTTIYLNIVDSLITHDEKIINGIKEQGIDNFQIVNRGGDYFVDLSKAFYPHLIRVDNPKFFHSGFQFTTKKSKSDNVDFQFEFSFRKYPNLILSENVFISQSLASRYFDDHSFTFIGVGQGVGIRSQIGEIPLNTSLIFAPTYYQIEDNNSTTSKGFTLKNIYFRSSAKIILFQARLGITLGIDIPLIQDTVLSDNNSQPLPFIGIVYLLPDRK
ncbi:MAG: hypothetical protein HQ510_04310 [Candidatus Marinimicrobia bacterium]|nr:hypothetical protein [Candidatus Neomarinimicrobiota bacterium]